MSRNGRPRTNQPIPIPAAGAAELGTTDGGIPIAREHQIPIRTTDLTRLLLSEPGLTSEEQVGVRHLSRLLGAWFHQEFFERHSRLKELYAPIDPDSDCITLPGTPVETAEDPGLAFLNALDETMERANFVRLSTQVIEEAVAAPNVHGLNFEADFSIFDHLRVYVRGYTQIGKHVRNLKSRFRRREVFQNGFKRMVVALKFRSDVKLDHFVRADLLYLRMFKDVPVVDIEMHLPEQGTKPRMRIIDKAQIASPIFTGLPLLAFKVVTGLMSPWAIGALIAPLTAGVNSFFGFQRAKQKHLHFMIRNLYYLTVANNSSVIARLIDLAEGEEFKEALLAYFWLWRNPECTPPWTVEGLDQAIEGFLEDRTGLKIDFEITDALDKLFRLGIVVQDDRGHLSAIPLNEALATLDRLWDDLFQFNLHNQGALDIAPPDC